MLQVGSGHGTLWRFRSINHTLEPVPHMSRIRSKRPPLLFIHGVEFASEEEAMRDLVHPMLEALGEHRIADKEIYVFVWNSLITNHTHISSIMKGRTLDSIKLAFKELPRCASYLRDLERRAKEAAKTLVPFALEWNSENQVGPTVITHSMGGLVWAETMKLVTESANHLTRPGIWWSLQPALPRSSLCPGGDYDIIPKLYTGHESARALVWYSRLDHVLSTIYIAAKKDLALGQWGCPKRSVLHRDITSRCKEAHGMLHLSSRLGHFFKRVTDLVQLDANELNI